MSGLLLTAGLLVGFWAIMIGFADVMSTDDSVADRTTVTRTAPPGHPWANSCPLCGAIPTEPCRTAGQSMAKSVHKAREPTPGMLQADVAAVTVAKTVPPREKRPFHPGIGSAFGVAAVALLVGGLVWPTGGWKNEWSNGNCLAWRVNRYAGGLVTQVVHGPHVVEDRWC